MRESEKIAEMKAFASNNLRHLDELELSETRQLDRNVYARLLRAALGLEALHKRQVVHDELAPKSVSNTNSHHDNGDEVDHATETVLEHTTESTAGEAVRWMASETSCGASEKCASDVYAFGMCIPHALSSQVQRGKCRRCVVKSRSPAQ